MVADNTARMNRYRVLPLRGRLAILVQNAPWLCAAAEAPSSRDPKFAAALKRAITLGEQACLERLPNADLLEIDSQISSIVSRQAKLAHFVPDSEGNAPSPVADVLRESAHVCVRILLATKALQTDSFGDASEHLNEGFQSLLEYMDEAVAVVAGFQTAGQQSRLLKQRFAGIDAQLEQVATFAESTRPGNSSLWTADEFARLRRVGQETGKRGQADAPRGNGPQTPTTKSDSPTSIEMPKKKGLGVGAFFVFLAVMKMISRMDGCGKGPQKAARQGPPQVREEPQPNLDQLQQKVNDVVRLQRIQAALTEAEEATSAGNPSVADAALQRARTDLQQLPNVDLLDDGLTRVLIAHAGTCADMLRSSQPKQSLEVYEIGIRAARSLAGRSDSLDDRSILAALLNNNAIALHELDRTSEALERLTEAEQLQRRALDAEPTSEQYRSFLSSHYACLVDVHVSLKQWGSAVEAALKGRALWTTQSEPLYEAACNLATLATAIRDCPDEVPERQQWVSELTRQGLEALRAARGSDLNLEQEIQQNGVLQILAANGAAPER